MLPAAACNLPPHETRGGKNNVAWEHRQATELTGDMDAGAGRPSVAGFILAPKSLILVPKSLRRRIA
jgi:hypothetical protein